MKNFFEFFGFVSTACVSGLLVFTFIGKKEGKTGGIERDRLVSEYSTAAIEGEDMPAPKGITGRNSRKSEDYAFTAAGAYGSKKSKKIVSEPVIETEPEMTAEEKLRALPTDESYIKATAKKWKHAVSGAAEEYNVRPQVLLAHVLVASYLQGGYSGADLQRDAARHGGERVGSVASALKKYKYGWTMQRLLSNYDLAGYFPEEIPVAQAAVSRPAKSVYSTPKGVANAKQSSPVEEGFRQMVAKDYGFSSWSGMQRLGDPETKAAAQKRVKSLMAAARIR